MMLKRCVVWFILFRLFGTFYFMRLHRVSFFKELGLKNLYWLGTVITGRILQVCQSELGSLSVPLFQQYTFAII